MRTVSTSLPQLLSAAHAAELLATTPGVVYNVKWRRRVGLRAVRVGHALRFLVSDLEALIARGVEPSDHVREEALVRPGP